MQIIRHLAETRIVADPELRTLIEQTIAALSQDAPFDPDVLGYFLIVQPGDSLADIDAQLGFSILTNRWTGIRYDQPGYTPSFEILQEHAGYFELVFVLSDDGYGVELFVPKAAGVDPELLAMCIQFTQSLGSASTPGALS